MSIKDIFKEKKSKPLKSHSLETAGKEAESSKFVEQFLDDKTRFVPQVDYSDPANFARFGLAEKYYEDSIKRIYMTYPYDGSFYERTAWMNSSSYFDLYVFDQLYPRTNGHALFSPGAPADHASVANKGETVHGKTYKYGIPTAKEYILIQGGPSSDPDDTDIKKIFPDITSKTKDNRAANVYKVSSNQESNLKIGGIDGNTIEFWLKKDAWTYNATANAQNEVLFDLYNINAASSSHAYSRLRVELDGKPSVDSPIRVTYMSGTNGCFQVPLGNGSGSTSGSVYVTKATVADGSWHHYAIVLQNTGSNLLNPRKTVNGTAVAGTIPTTGSKPLEAEYNLSALQLDLYVDGYHNTTVITGSSLDYVSASLHATIGALAAAPSSSTQVFEGTTMLGAGKLSASIDDFRFWKKARTAKEIGNFWNRDVGGGTNVDTANTDLGVYYKFNEGITGQSATDSTVLDYSGRISNGAWTGYSTNSRSTKSAIVQSSASATEFKDPIIYSIHSDVDTLLTEKRNKGRVHDFQNPAALYYKLPEWITSEDASAGEELKNLTQIIASYFDTLAMQIKSVAELRNITYPSASHKPLPFADKLLESQGFITSEIFSDATIVEEFLQIGDKKVYQEKLNNIKNLIYKNIYNNLNFIYKSKGTEKSFRNFIRCFGIDDDHIRLNLYANNSTFELKDNFRYTTKKKKYVDFDDSTRNAAVVFQMSGSGLTAATATITFTGDPTANQTITITSADGTSLTYTAKNSGNSAARTFDCNNGVTTSATTLQAAIEDSTASTGGHAGDITVSRDGATLTLTQAGKGVDGNVSITHNLSNTTVTGFAGGSGNSHRRYLKSLPSHEGLGMTFECEAIFPKKRPLNSRGYYPFSDLTASVFGIHTPLEQSDADQHTQFAGTDSANFQVLVYKEKADSPHVKFALTSSTNTLNFTSDNAVASHINTIKNYGLTSSQFYDVYTNQRWNFAVRIKPKTNPWWPKVSGSGPGRSYHIDFYGVSYVGDTPRDSFHLTASMREAKGHAFMNAPKRLYVGAHRTNFTGAIQQRADMKIASPKVWMTYLTNEEIKAHARDTDNYGVNHPYRNAYFMEGTGSRPIPKIETLALNWDFSTLSSSDASGEFTVPDISSGSSDLIARYGNLSQIINNQHAGVGYGFVANATDSFDTEYVSTAKQQSPEVANSSEMIEIRSRDDVRFIRDQRPINYYYALEKSPYQAISDEMLNFFATIVDFNNLIGEPVNRYRDSYKQMEKIRSLFFERVRNDVDVERYINFYRWLDNSIGEMAEQLYPASAQHSEGLRTVIESHVLERNKYRSKFPTLESRDIDAMNFGSPSHLTEKAGTYESSAPMQNVGMQYSSQGDDNSDYNSPEAQSPLPQDKNLTFWANFRDQFYDLPDDVNTARIAVTKIVQTADSQIVRHKPDFRTYSRHRVHPHSPRFKPYSFSADLHNAIELGSDNPQGRRIDLVSDHSVDSSNNIKDKIVLVAGSILLSPREKISAKRRENGSENAFDDGLRHKVKVTPELSRNSAGDLGGYREYSHFTKGTFSVYTSSLGLEFTNLHQDLGRTGHSFEGSLQGPFTKKHVGTMPHRSVAINIGNSGSLDSIYDRPEAFRISAPASDLVIKVAATATITFTGDPTVNQAITITSTDGTSLTYTAKTSGNSAARTFDCNNGVATSATTLQAAIEDSTAGTGGHAGKITVSRDGATLTLTQATKGADGNISITHNLSNTTVTGFSGGKGKDINIYPPEAKLDGTLDLKNKRSVFQRVEPKRLVNIRNIQNKRKVEVLDPQNKEALGNFTRNYEVVQTSGRREQGQWFADNIETSGSALQNGLEIPVLRDEPTASPSNLGLKDFELLERETKESVFVERFSAPGGYEVMSRGYLDRRGEEVSAYNSLNYRNLFIRNSSGSMDNGPIAATATITFTGDPTANQTITITSTNGTSLTYTAKNTANSAARTFDCNNGPSTSATTLKAAIEDSTAGTGGHAGKIIVSGITVSRDTAILTLTQATKGTAGNVSITHNLSNTTVTGFTGGLALHRGVLGEFSNRTRFSGTVNIDGNDATKHDGLNALLSRRSGKFGVDSVYGNVRDIDYHTTASYHKINRNPLRRLKFSGEKDWPEDRGVSRADLAVTGTVYDNYWVSHAIPRSEFQYAWITASATTNVLANDQYGHTGTGQDYDGYMSTSAGFVPAITFVSESHFGSYTWISSGRRYFGEAKDYGGSTTKDFIPTDFVGINTNIYEPLSSSTNILGFPSLVAENLSGTPSLLEVNYINQLHQGGSSAGEETDDDPDDFPGLGSTLNAILLHRNGPYQYPSWKQIRTGEHPIARHKRNRNLIDVNTVKIIKESISPPGEAFYETPYVLLKIGQNLHNMDNKKMFSIGSTVFGKPSSPTPSVSIYGVNAVFSLQDDGKPAPQFLFREDITPHTMSAVTDAYPPIIQTVSDLDGNTITLKHAYGNNIEYMPIDSIDAKFNLDENTPKQAHDVLVEEIVDKKSMVFKNLKYSETIYPREENQHLAKVRGRLAYSEQTKTELSQFRMGQQRIFWRDTLADRQLNSDYNGGSSAAAINSMGFRQEFRAGVTGSHALRSRPARPNGDHRDNGNIAHYAFPALSVWPLDGHQHSGSRQPEFSRDGSAQPTASHTIGELLNPVSYVSMYSAINGFNKFGAANSSAKSYFAPTTASQLYMYPSVPWLMTRDGSDSYTMHYHENTTDRFWRTPEFSGKKPWFDSYDEYAKDIRYMAKDHTVIPEFRISEHMDYYISNGFKFNNRFLTLEGAGTINLQNKGVQIHPLSASATSPGATDYNEDFFTVYSHSDFMKHFGKVSKDYEAVATPSEFTLRCHGVKKLLPYQGFYPVLRCTQLGSLFSQSYAPYISGSNLTHTTASALHINFEGSDDAQHLMTILQPFYSPGIMYNTIKSGIAVDYPIVTGAVSPFGHITRGATSDKPQSFLSGGIADSSGATIYNKGNNHIFNFRMPFEAIIQPHDYIPVSSSVTQRSLRSGNPGLGINRMTFVWPHTGSQINPPHIFADWTGDYDNKYSLAAHNFFAEIPSFFLKEGLFKSFSSAPESKFKQMNSGSTYYMDIELYKTDDFIMFQGVSNVTSNDYTQYSSLNAASNLFGEKVGYETFVSGTTSAKGAVFGPPSQWYLTGSDDMLKKGVQNKDPAFAPFTPPYYYGRSIARIAFTPDRHVDMLEGESRAFTLDEILGGAKMENTSKPGGYADQRYTYFSSSNQLLGKSYDTKMPAGLSQMRITSSVNLFGVTRDKAVEYQLEGGKVTPTSVTDQASTDFNRWVIGTKFECPILNFSGNEVGNLASRFYWRSPTNNSSDWTTSNQSWDIYANTVFNPDVKEHFSSSVPVKGMWSGYGSVPRGTKEGIFLRLKDSFPEKLAAGNEATGSLIDVCGFKAGSQRMGELAEDYEKEIFEAIVAIPFIQEGDKRKFFTIPREQVDAVVNNGTSDDVPKGSVHDMVTKLQKYVMPPHMDFLKNKGIDPFAVYVFEFSHRMKQKELTDIWQNVMPEIAERAEEQEVVVSHELGPGEFFNGGSPPPETRWMVFKIKQKAKMNYFEQTADSTDDDRFKFEFKVGEAKIAPDYSYNWPYDFFSLVELAKIDAEVVLESKPCIDDSGQVRENDSESLKSC